MDSTFDCMSSWVGTVSYMSVSMHTYKVVSLNDLRERAISRTLTFGVLVW